MKNPITLSGALRTTVAVMATLLIVSCQKEINPLDEPAAGDNEPVGESYLPLTPGTKWQYRESTTQSSYWSTVTNEKKTEDGIEYVKIFGESVQDNSTPTNVTIHDGYMAKVGPNYYSLVNLEDEERGYIKYYMRYLNDQEAVGFEWLDEGGSTNELPIRIRGKIIAKGLTETENGRTYKNVIHTKITLEIQYFDDEWDVMNTYDMYSAKGVGVIRNVTAYYIMGTEYFQNTMSLLNFSIK